MELEDCNVDKNDILKVAKLVLKNNLYQFLFVLQLISSTAIGPRFDDDEILSRNG